VEQCGMIDGGSFQLDKEVIAFVDLLGTAMKTEFVLDGHSQEDGSYKFSIAPTVSTFSDNIVLSFRVNDYDLGETEAEFMEKIYLEMVLRQTRTMVGKLAEEALKIGMLVRGGMTLGELYHREGVVLGSGLVEAYGLESTVSKYPRITISSSIYSRIHVNDRGANMRRDKDGIWNLDYFKHLNLATNQDLALARQVSDLVDQNISAMSKVKDTMSMRSGIGSDPNWQM
jgi:hypothetical protein